jgi:ABC-type dipeptide/oligopeptide/nickel transport system permease component
MFAVLLVVSALTFFVMYNTPGSPFDSEKGLPDRVAAAIRAKYNLDLPVIQQYLIYMGDIVIPRIELTNPPPSTNSVPRDYLINIQIFSTENTFRWMNFGPTFSTPNRSVNDIFKDHLPVSFQLGVAAFVIALVIGLPTGIAAALGRNTWMDYASMSIALLGVSIPAIISGPLLRYFFGVALQWLPPTGWGEFKHIILPSIALGFSSSAIIARLTRASLLQVLNEDYIRTARAKGLSERVVISVHALKNSMIPVVTILGPLFAGLTTGTFVVELIFGIPGLGSFFISSIGNRDYPVIMGVTLLYGIFLVIANLFVDIVYALLDPRISY